MTRRQRNLLAPHLEGCVTAPPIEALELRRRNIPAGFAQGLGGNSDRLVIALTAGSTVNVDGTEGFDDFDGPNANGVDRSQVRR